MIDVDFIFVFVLILILNKILLGYLSKKYSFVDKPFLNKLFWYHLVFFILYFLFAIAYGSDSMQYYEVAEKNTNWNDLFETGTRFISFVGVPFIHLGFSFGSMMLFFSWFGYVGFVYAYLYFRESITVNIIIFRRFDLLKLLLFLPNMHFWTASFGKGSLIFMGLMLFTFAVKFPQKRIWTLVIGGFFIYMVRPHVMLFVLVGVMIGILTGKGRISLGIKLLVLVASIGFLAVASNTILGMAKLQNSQNVVDDFEQFSSTASEKLSSSASTGVSMNNYPLPLKLFTFWFRPLFIDGSGLLGLFSSVENLVYLLLFVKICNRRFIRFFRKASYMVKMSAIVFLLSSYALTFVMGNLGIMMRQKSMVMYFGFFVIYYFLAQEKYDTIIKNKKQEEKRILMNKTEVSIV